MGLTKLVIRGARQHNLKNISLEIPRNSLTVITGLSGSGKSSLAFDTIYAEGQRRYVESLSAYARQFLDQMERPEVDVIEGLSPAICDRTENHNAITAVPVVRLPKFMIPARGVRRRSEFRMSELWKANQAPVERSDCAGHP